LPPLKVLSLSVANKQHLADLFEFLGVTYTFAKPFRCLTNRSKDSEPKSHRTPSLKTSRGISEPPLHSLTHISHLRGSYTFTTVRAALKAQGIATKDIKSSNLSVFPEYNYTQDKGSVIVGYRATQSFTVVIRKADTAGKVVEAVVNAGNENITINGIVPSITKGSAAMEEARAAAVADARARAASNAKLLGTSLGKVVYLHENSAASYSFPMLGVAKTQADGGTPEKALG